MPQAFRWHLAKALAGADLTEVAAAANGMTGAEVAATVRDAKASARRDRVPLAPGHLMTAVRDRRPPLDPSLRRLVALHESGHAIVAHATSCAHPHQLTLNAGGGWAAMRRPAIKMQRADFEREIACLLAGRAAETLVLGQPSGGAGGSADSDLARAQQRPRPRWNIPGGWESAQRSGAQRRTLRSTDCFSIRRPPRACKHIWTPQTPPQHRSSSKTARFLKRWPTRLTPEAFCPDPSLRGFCAA